MPDQLPLERRVARLERLLLRSIQQQGRGFAFAPKTNPDEILRVLRHEHQQDVDELTETVQKEIRHSA